MKCWVKIEDLNFLKKTQKRFIRKCIVISNYPMLCGKKEKIIEISEIQKK